MSSLQFKDMKSPHYNKALIEWNKIEDGLPDFNGKVIIRYEDKGEIKERNAWYETGDRRFPKGFSLLPPYLISKIIEWRYEIIRGKENEN